MFSKNTIEEPKRVAIYARVSTKDKGQNPETQTKHLHKIAKERGYVVVREYIEYESARSTKRRMQYKQMMKDAALPDREFDAIMVMKIDRLHRNVLKAMVMAAKCIRHKIELISSMEYVDFLSPMGLAMFGFMSVIAQLESDTTTQRSMAGTERAKAEGKLCHRPPRVLTDEQREQAYRILAENPGISQNRLAEQFTGIGKNTIIKLLKENGIIAMSGRPDNWTVTGGGA